MSANAYLVRNTVLQYVTLIATANNPNLVLYRYRANRAAQGAERFLPQHAVYLTYTTPDACMTTVQYHSSFYSYSIYVI